MVNIINNLVKKFYNYLLFYFKFYNQFNLLISLQNLNKRLNKVIDNRNYKKLQAELIYKKICKLYDISKKKNICTPEISYSFNSSALLMADEKNWKLSRKKIIKDQNNLKDKEELEFRDLSIIEPSHIVCTLGHTLNLDSLIKSIRLNLASKQKLILPVSKYFQKKIVNRCLLKYWEKYIDIIYDEKQSNFYLKKLNNLRVWDNVSIPCGEEDAIQYHSDSVYIQKKWEEKNYSPLLSLTQEHKERGFKNLEKIGISRNDWFVILHVRSHNTKKDNLEILNPDLHDYYPAIKEITKNGGWVIRIGDKTMEKLDPMDNVYDYAHSNLKSDWMDIFLMGSAKFMLGTSSGPSVVSHVFGVPIVMTNFSSLTSIYLGKKDIILLSKFFDLKTNQNLPYRKVAKLPYSWAYNKRWLRNHFNIATNFNSSNEIKIATSEMMHKLNNKKPLNINEEYEIQKKFKKIFKESKNFIGLTDLEIQCNISKNFFLTNENLFI